VKRKNARVGTVASLATVVATLGFAATAVPGAAEADPGIERPAPAAGEPQNPQSDNRPDALSRKQAALRQRAVDALVAGDAKMVGKGSNRTIKLAGGDRVDYPAEQTAQLLTFLVEFGDDDSNPAFPENTEGPLHNEIPEPGADDNTTYWEPDFDRQLYLDTFFNGLDTQHGESFKDMYNEMSSGRFDLEGDVSDWVKVPNAASYYQDADGEETGDTMIDFLQDAGDAWYADQVADGKSLAEIQTFLESFDQWDRFDYDGDLDFDEPDGYVDHFQAVHAGEDESAGAPAWAIWAHRGSVNSNGNVGPAGNENGGIEIGNTGLWIRDYTVEPENGGLGVFAHEFAHDLGVPDYYDTQGGDNGTGFWTLMSQGSWNGHAEGAIGTTPNHMGAPDKLFLGWYGNDDLQTVSGTGTPQQVVLGPSYHATDVGKQALAVTLPQGHATVDVVEPDQGTHYFYSGNGDDRRATVTSPTVTVPSGDPTLDARVSYSIEDDWDYAYLEVSDDGGTTWDHVETNLSTTTDPNQQNDGFGITGCSGTRDGDGICDNAWTDLSADLTAYAGQQVKVRFEMFNDAAYHELGFSVDSISLGGTLVTDVEDGAPTWTLDGFRVIDGSSYTLIYDQYYLAENKTYDGYDKTLSEGPYSADYPLTAPQKVDQYPYQDGLLIWYVNGRYQDNDVSGHPGGGEALPIDSNPEYVMWTKNGAPIAYDFANLNPFDATFDVDQTDGLHLTKENASGPRHWDVDAQPSVPVFEDTDPDAYWDDSDPITEWYSTKVAGVGTMIQVLSSDETKGEMVVRAGKKFVAATSKASITGTATVGQTLTAHAPDYFNESVTPTYQWQVDGTNVAGAVASTYVVKPGDIGKAITVVVTGTKAGYVSSTDTAPAVTAEEGSSPTATKAVAIVGTPTVGQTLTATPATWSVDGTSTFAWMAGSTVVGTGTSYALKPADTGLAIRVKETRTADGHEVGTSTSAATSAVAPAPVTMTVDAPKKVKRNKKATVTVTVSSPGLVPPGAIQVTFGGEPVSDKVLTGGTVTFKLPKQSTTGKKKLELSYVSSQIGYAPASTTVTIKVTRR